MSGRIKFLIFVYAVVVCLVPNVVCVHFSEVRTNGQQLRARQKW